MYGACSTSLRTDRALIHFKTASNNMRQLQSSGAFALDETDSVVLAKNVARELNDPLAHAVLDAMCTCNCSLDAMTNVGQ